MSAGLKNRRPTPATGTERTERGQEAHADRPDSNAPGSGWVGACRPTDRWVQAGRGHYGGPVDLAHGKRRANGGQPVTERDEPLLSVTEVQDGTGRCCSTATRSLDREGARPMSQPTEPTEPTAAFRRGQLKAYGALLVELEELTTKVRREVASLTLPTRKPRPHGGE